MTHMPRNEGRPRMKQLWREGGKVFVVFLRSCAIRSEFKQECKSKINKRFDIVPGDFEKVPYDKALPL